jgi:ferrous iron transport protein B
LLEAYHNQKKEYDIDFDMVMPNARYEKIMDIVSKTHIKNNIDFESQTDKIDKVLTNKYLGLPIFGLIMFLVFFLAFGPIGTFITDQFVWLINEFFKWIINGVDTLGMAPYIASLITNGIFGGLAAVVGFLPQLAILFFALSILEDSGYMARAAFIMDRALRRFGLSGKSFIPMLIGFGCSVPAMASTRTLDKDEDRKLTTMIIPFVSCGAKAPIYGVFAGALFGNGSFLVVFSMYILGLLVAILSAILFKKTIFKSAQANYIMELPEYRMPTLKNILLHTWEKCKDFLIKAGTILLAAFMVIWFLSYFGFVDGQFRLLQESEIGNSLLGSIGRFLLPLFKPIGFTDWQATVAMLTGLVAKESVVGTLGILYGVNGDVIENGTLLYSSIQANFTSIQAYAFMAFALLSVPCIAAVSAMKRELNSWKWFVFIILYELVVAYLIAFAIFQLGSIPIGDLRIKDQLVEVVKNVIRHLAVIQQSI